METKTETAADNRKFTAIILEEPIMRGETEIATITLRKPQAGELRGLSLQDLLTSEVGAILKLIPRISDPMLADQEANALSPSDFAQAAGTIRGFFLTAGERKMMDQMLADRTSTT